MRAIILLIHGLFAALVAGSALGESLYVTDELRLRVQEEPNESSRVLANAGSGTQLEVLARDRFYARVRTPEGLVGWVKAAYLVEDKPARARVVELESENAGLRARLEPLEESATETEARRKTLQAKLSQAELRAAEQDEQLRVAGQQLEDFRARLERQGLNVALWELAAGLAAALVLGVLITVRVQDFRSRRRHGGFRIF